MLHWFWMRLKPHYFPIVSLTNDGDEKWISMNKFDTLDRPVMWASCSDLVPPDPNFSCGLWLPGSDPDDAARVLTERGAKRAAAQPGKQGNRGQLEQNQKSVDWHLQYAEKYKLPVLWGEECPYAFTSKPLGGEVVHTF
jgi:hypothetical protein